MYSEGFSDAIMMVKMKHLSLVQRIMLLLRPMMGFITRPRGWTSLGLARDDQAQFYRRCECRHRFGMMWGLMTHASASK